MINQPQPVVNLRGVHTVLLADDHPMCQDGIMSMLDGSEFEVVGVASSGNEVIEKVGTLNPDVVLLDIRMPGRDGLDTLSAIKKDYPKIAVLMLTTYDNPTYMARAIAGGAAGYLLKGVGQEELLTAMRSVINGDSLLSMSDLQKSLRGFKEHASSDKELIRPLSEREREVLSLVASGLPNKDIGSILFIAESTVKTHVEHILEKIGVSDRVQAAVWAVRNGVVANNE